MIDYDGRSESKQPRHLFSEDVFGDYVLRVDWRIKETPFVNPRVPIVLRDGTNKKDIEGKDIRLLVPDTDSGIYLRGDTKAQIDPKTGQWLIPPSLVQFKNIYIERLN